MLTTGQNPEPRVQIGVQYQVESIFLATGSQPEWILQSGTGRIFDRATLISALDNSSLFRPKDPPAQDVRPVAS
jgi:hypothetical protein